MDNANLNTELADLHKELSAVSAIDERSRGLLSLIKSDIDNILTSKEDHTSHHKTLLFNLEEYLEEVEVAHPQLTNTINTVIGTLNNLGI